MFKKGLIMKVLMQSKDENRFAKEWGTIGNNDVVEKGSLTTVAHSHSKMLIISVSTVLSKCKVNNSQVKAIYL